MAVPHCIHTSYDADGESILIFLSTSRPIVGLLSPIPTLPALVILNLSVRAISFPTGTVAAEEVSNMRSDPCTKALLAKLLFHAAEVYPAAPSFGLTAYPNTFAHVERWEPNTLSTFAHEYLHSNIV